MKIKKTILIGICFALILPTKPVNSYESPFYASSIIPETQSGFMAEAYEVKVGHKLTRGVQNTFLGWLEIPHGVKSEISYRKQEYLHAGVETFFIGTFKGLMNAIGRTGVGIYEVFTCPYAQDPILPEMDEWLY